MEEKTIEAIYKYGRLYDAKTKKRILPKDGVKLEISGQEQDFLKIDPKLGTHGTLKSSVELAKEVYEKYKNEDANTGMAYWKLFSEDDVLYFKIGIKISETSKKKDYLIFRLRFLEDLYLRKRGSTKLGELYECQCVIEHCYNDFEFFEKLYAKSLNDARTKIHELYFSLVANPAANVFKEFYVDQACTKTNRLDNLREKKQDERPLNEAYRERFEGKKIF